METQPVGPTSTDSPATTGGPTTVEDEAAVGTLQELMLQAVIQPMIRKIAFEDAKKLNE